jgi:hypothetical protein
MRSCSDHIRPVLWLEHGQARSVHETEEDLAHIERLADIRIDEAEDVVCWVERFSGFHAALQWGYS